MIDRKEYIEKNKEKVKLFQWSEPCYSCPKCVYGGMCKRLDIVLASNPPQYEYQCDACGFTDYLPY